MRTTAILPARWRGVLFCAALLLTLCGCGRGGSPSAPLCQVVVESGEYYGVFGCVQTVERGGDVSFRVKLTGDHLIASADYPDYEVEDEEISSVDGTNYQRLTLHNVRYSTVVSLSLCRPRLIRYHANGGVRADGGEGEVVEVSASLSHMRLNTALGTELFARPGHTQTGWNTAPDGSGTAVGQGSRMDPDGGTELYAQWSPWTPAERFTCAIEDGGAVITGYTGADRVLTLPGTLGGYPVRDVKSGALAGAPCEALILPPGLTQIEPGAFAGAAVREVWLYDDLTEVEDATFDGCPIETVHLNAARPPVYSGTYFDTFPDKMDRLWSLRDVRKLVLAGGSSVRFGFDSETLDMAFPDYAVADMGVFAYTNALPQYELILQYMGPGDLLLSTPEFDAIPEQFCATNRLGYEFFVMTEADYDLLAQLDCTHYTGLWDAFGEYQQARDGMPPKGYAVSARNYDEDQEPLSGAVSYNEYGDYICPRPNQAEDKAFGIKLADYDPASYTPERLDGLNRVYQSFLDRGVRVFFSYAPRSLRAITPESTPAARAELDALLREKLCVPVISPIEDSLFSGYYFYGTDNHLSDEGVTIRTERAIDDLTRALYGSNQKGASP